MKLFLLFVCVGIAYVLSAKNPDLSAHDKWLIRKLVQIDKTDGKALEEFFTSQKQTFETTNLGFGWKVWNPYRGVHVCLRGEFYYFNDSLISFRIEAKLPKDSRNDKNQRRYGDFFQTDDNGDLLPHSINEEALYEPLTPLDDSLQMLQLNQDLRALMKPIFCLNYGRMYGSSGLLTEERQLFQQNLSTMDADVLKYLSHAINPSTRFLAIEELIRRNYIQQECTMEDWEWITQCFAEVPTLKMANGCFMTTQYSMSLVFSNALRGWPY